MLCPHGIASQRQSIPKATLGKYLAMARPLALTLTVSPLLRAGFSVFGDFVVPACGLIQAAEAGIGRDAAAMGQIIHGVITGIGFIGGGAILKTSNEVRGTATAASLWATALGDGSGRRGPSALQWRWAATTWRW